MTIFGSFSALPALEVFAALRGQVGVLHVEQEENWKVFIDDSNVVGIQRAGFPVESPDPRRELDILFNCSANFRFEPASDLVRDFELPLTNLIYEQSQRTEQCTRALPSLETEFELAQDGCRLTLNNVLDAAKSLLHERVNANRLAENLGTSPADAQQMLYRLELVGLARRVQAQCEHLSRQPNTPMKVLVSGPVGAGKTTFVNILGGAQSFGTEELASESIGKAATTVAMDFGTVAVGEHQVQLFGTPGQERFAFMWDILREGAQGLLLLIAGDKPSQISNAQRILEFVNNRRPIPVVVGVTRQDLAPVWTPKDVAAFLRLDIEQVTGLAATNRSQALQTLETLVKFISRSV